MYARAPSPCDHLSDRDIQRSHSLIPFIRSASDHPSRLLGNGEENFGPVTAISKFSTEDEVVRRANNCKIGLASHLMTSDLNKAYRVPEKLESGMVGIVTGVIYGFTVP
jgi:hypothetical protein